MAREMAELEGRVTLRPWRLGLLVDTSSATDVREAIAKLSSVWGGIWMPILDVRSSIQSIEATGELYDVDALYSEVTDGLVGELLRKPGWRWEGRASFGAFGGDFGLRRGLLPLKALLRSGLDFAMPTWAAGHPDDLLLTATFGLAESLDAPLDEAADGRAVVGLGYLAAKIPPPTVIGALELGQMYLSVVNRRYLKNWGGIHILRGGAIEDVLEFWNARAFGSPLIALPAERTEGNLVEFLLRRGLPTLEPYRSMDGAESVSELPVWGLTDAGSEVQAIIRAAAGERGLSVAERPRGHREVRGFSGVRTSIQSSVRAETRPSSRAAYITLPRLPIREDDSVIEAGIVAAEVTWQSSDALDPRLSPRLPPHRRHSALVAHALATDGVEHVRVSVSGVVLGLDAHRDRVRVPLGNTLEAFRLLFDDADVEVSQSEVGLFQARAAERFGGPFSGFFSQPAARAALETTASRVEGITMPHLVQTVQSQRGGWPHPVMEPHVTPSAYATRVVHNLLFSGVFVPTTRVHCSHCRVQTRVSSDDLASRMQCEFCGEVFDLALSHALTKPEWRYRLAAHLRSDQVQALLPALAASSFLAQLRHTEEPPMPLVLGLQVEVDGRSIEVDVAAYIPDTEWITVLGEVKTGNRIDIHDVDNLVYLRERLARSGVRCILMFATLKDGFSPEEVATLRGLAERSHPTWDSMGRLVPNLPLTLTGLDLSHHPMDESHPWRWAGMQYAGLYGTAVESCRRNLGLTSCELSGSEVPPSLSWGD
ncbi:hypothetical protein [Ornithinimicrobium cerasi]|uniref:Uncharacterized protein n=1 Tax=Ornithinimicrobium cerasi TaxID=2248773 RepID=A0A285VV66_9MICO|nr:hypothetical protein [Ornithinimicrobium cerasi]SOC57767.1 hypothetical protein SAMN05421879_1164 [Ornithinimicrobium cerasi]